MRRNSKSIYVYSKMRKDFGRQLLFQNVPGHIIDSINPDKEMQKQYMLRNPVHSEVQVSFPQAEHEVNTDKKELIDEGVNHTEGGWPRDLQLNNEEHLERYRRHIKHEENYSKTVLSLTPVLEHYVNQNNAIDMYHAYFSGMVPQPPIEKYNLRVSNAFRDPLKRLVSSIVWTNESKSKLAVAYYPYESTYINDKYKTCFIWDVNIQTEPVYKLIPKHICRQLTCSPIDPVIFVAGLDSGQVCVFDIREGPMPVSTSSIYNSHLESVTALNYTHSRTNTEFFTGSSDGRCLWWDQRDISKPLNQLYMSINMQSNEEPNMNNAQGISALEFDNNLPTKFLCGTESGLVINANRLGKTHSEILSSYWDAHSGPVRAIHRSPCTIRMFITCGDWSVRIWSEEVHSAPIIVTNPYRHEITDVSWTPLRYSSYMSVCSGGTFYYWDLLRKYKEPLVSLQVSKHGLMKISPHSNGEFVATGDDHGTIYLLKLSENMVFPGKNDKQLMFQTYERETKREHILDARVKEIRLKAKVKEEAPPKVVPDEEQLIEEAEEIYFKIVAEELEQLDITPSDMAIA